MNEKNKQQEIFPRFISSGLVRKLKQTRAAQKLTQSGLASKLGVNQSSIAKIEKGITDPPASKLMEMARVLGFELLLVPKDKTTAVQALLKSTRRSTLPTFKDLLGVSENEEF